MSAHITGGTLLGSLPPHPPSYTDVCPYVCLISLIFACPLSHFFHLFFHHLSHRFVSSLYQASRAFVSHASSVRHDGLIWHGPYMCPDDCLIVFLSHGPVPHSSFPLPSLPCASSIRIQSTLLLLEDSTGKYRADCGGCQFATNTGLCAHITRTRTRPFHSTT